MRGLEYAARLRSIGLFSVKGRLLRLDLCKVWKCFHADVDVGLIGVLELASEVGTRGHGLKLSVPICRSEIGRKIFGSRVVRVWNSLPSSVVEASSVELFQRGLDLFLGDQLFGHN